MSHSFNLNYLHYFQTPLFIHKKHHIFDSLREISSIYVLFQNTVRHLKLVSTFFSLVFTREHILSVQATETTSFEVMNILSQLYFNLIVIRLPDISACLPTNVTFMVKEFSLPSPHNFVFYPYSPSLIQKNKSQRFFLNQPPMLAAAIASTQFQHTE